MRVSVIGPLDAFCRSLLHCHQFEAQQMILAAASLVQLGVHGSVPQRAMMIQEEDTGRKGKEEKTKQIPNLAKVGNKLKIGKCVLEFTHRQ